jgi:hypothetical protein
LKQPLIPNLVKHLPYPCFIVDQKLRPVFINEAALETFESTDALVEECLVAPDFSLHQPCKYVVEHMGQSLRITSILDEHQIIVFVNKLEPDSHVRNEASPLHPAREALLKNLQNLLNTTRGYAELITVMLDEETAVSGERLAAVRRYEQHLNDHLTDMEALLADPLTHSADSRLETAMRPRAIVFFENQIRGELIAELFAAQGMEVSLAANSEAALEQVNGSEHEVQLGVFDQAGPATEQLLKRHPRSMVIYCNAEIELDDDNPRIGRVPDQPLDINDVLRVSVKMLSQF